MILQLVFSFIKHVVLEEIIIVLVRFVRSQFKGKWDNPQELHSLFKLLFWVVASMCLYTLQEEENKRKQSSTEANKN